MAESKRRHGRLKGVVLVMVVTIMFVLMIMLLATLAVVSSTTRRTYTKYEENQAYYTSRSVLEVYIKEYLESKNNLSDSDSEASSALTDVTSLLARNFDSSTIPAVADMKSAADNRYKDFAGNDVTTGFYFQQQIFGNLYPKYDWKGGDPKTVSSFTEDKYWEKRSDWETATATKPYYVEFEASLPDLTGTGTNSTGLFANKNTSGDQVTTVRVELLRVLFVSKDMSQYTDYNSVKEPSTGLDFNEIDWDKTYYRLKVSATTELGDGDADSEVTVSVILEPGVVVSPKGFNNAMTSMDATTNDTKVFTLGGGSASFASGRTYNIPNNSALVGNYVYKVDEVYINTTPSWNMPSDSYFVIYDGILNTQNQISVNGKGSVNATGTDLQKRPFLYASGAYIWGKVGTGTSNACDLIVSANNNGKLKSRVGWSMGSVPTAAQDDMALTTSGNGSEFYGDVYCDGNMYIPGNAKFHGKVYCTGDIYLGSATAATFDNDVTVAGTIKDTAGNDISSTVSGGTGSIYVNDTSLNGKDWHIDSGNLNDNNEMELDLPARGQTNIPTTDTVKSNYVYKTGDKIPAGKSVGDIISAEEMFRSSIGNDSASLSVSSSAPAFTPSTGTSGSSLSYSDPDTGVTYNVSGTIVNPASEGSYNANTDFYEMKLNWGDWANSSGTYYIDATTANVQIEMTGQKDSARPKFVIVGDKSVVFTTPDNAGNVQACEPKVLTVQIDQMLNNNEVFHLGEQDKLATPNSPEAPHIYFYIGKNVTFECRNGGGFLFSGYMYGPEAKFYANTNAGTTIKYTYEDVPDSGSNTQSHISIFGSMVFHTIETQNELGVVFIDTGSGGSSCPTGTRVVWGRQKYLNRG